MTRVIYRGLLASLAYVFLLDGYVRLRTGSSSLTLLRDVLPGGVALLGLAVLCVRHTKLQRGPLFGLVATFAAVAFVEVLNPDTVSIKLGLEALRQHLEFVPIFFIAFAVMRSEARLRGLALLMVVAAAANGIVGVIQSQLTLDQFAGLGTGYRTLITESTVPGAVHNARVFFDATGHRTLRPPALGGDFGFGGVLGMCALPFALALILAPSRRAHRWAGILALPLTAAAVVSSQTRAAVIAAVAAIVAFLWFAARERTLIVPAVVTVGLGVVVVALSGINLGRYDSITPTQVGSTFGAQRGGSFDLIPTYAAKYPLGAGLGTAGPAARLHSSVNTGKLSGENAFTFLTLELGIPGLVCGFALFAIALRRGARLARSRSLGSARLYLAAVSASLVGCSVLWFAGGVTAAPPGAPFVWLAFGVVAAWSLGPRPPATSRVMHGAPERPVDRRSGARASPPGERPVDGRPAET
ncbi:MAG: hypothetical protein ACR2KV_04310 [Solirubrobacteraceae bacterium]